MMPGSTATAVPSHRWRNLAAPFVLLLIVAFFWKVLLTGQYNWLQSPDLAYKVNAAAAASLLAILSALALWLTPFELVQ